jgi:hypothetical protein
MKNCQRVFFRRFGHTKRLGEARDPDVQKPIEARRLQVDKSYGGQGSKGAAATASIPSSPLLDRASPLPTLALSRRMSRIRQPSLGMRGNLSSRPARLNARSPGADACQLPVETAPIDIRKPPHHRMARSMISSSAGNRRCL